MRDTRYEVIIANDDLGRQIHYRLRYQVFCLETGYENPEAFPNREEKDEWDACSQHFLVRDRESKQWVATMRLILPSERMLPIETRAALDAGAVPPLEQCAEISRLCVVGQFRKRLRTGVSCEPLVPGESWAEPELAALRCSAQVLRALLPVTLRYSRSRGINYWYMFTTKALARIVTRALPMDLRQVGSPAWYRGERLPYLVDVRKVIHALASEQRARAASASIFYDGPELSPVATAQAG
ncbi:MAG TPA: PEP-CTERM/exosortase system-associated acyltransferase [Gammaproteobacteria bacterium]|nr:PEP-CTERM/exosortase system-associated acyltransferase [Gammaproteobacteria bacterium]